MNNYENFPSGQEPGNTQKSEIDTSSSTAVTEENKAKLLNDYLFENTANGNYGRSLKETDIEKKSSKKLLVRIGALALVLVMAFFGAFYGMVFVCESSILGDSDFFAAFMARWAGVTENRVEVDYITGEYTGNNIELADKMLGCTVLVRTVYKNTQTNTVEPLSHGSGVIYSYNSDTKTALIVTNHHVIENGGDILIETYAGERIYGKLKATDSASDIALIEISSDTPLTAPTHADSDKLKLGQSASIAGNPLGHGFSVNFGYISSKSVATNDSTGPLVQLDISVNPGNSGGGVFDGEGNLIGLVVSKASGDNIDGIGYAIPINKVNSVINDLLKFGYVQGRPALGITVVNIMTEIQYNSLMQNELKDYLPDITEKRYGVYIIESKNSSLKVGDRIISIDGISVTTNNDIARAISSHKPGDSVKIIVERVTKDGDGYSFTKTTEQVLLGTRDWADSVG